MNGSAAAGRTNQRARTRAALIQAAIELVREGRPPSIPEAADRALISAATAYRYFPSAEELWFEASAAAVAYEPALIASRKRVDAAGDDPVDRLEALVQSIGFTMLDDQVPYRRLAQGALENWFSQADTPAEHRTPVRERRRIPQIAHVLEPLRNRLSDDDLDRIARALGAVVGTDIMIALTDGVGLEVDEAKPAMLDAARWLLTGALTELDPGHIQRGSRSQPSEAPRRSTPSDS